MKKTIIGILTGIIAMLGGYVGYQQMGGSMGARVTIYGSETGTTAVTSTSKIINLGDEFDIINLNIKASTTAAQNIAVYPEFSNDPTCATGSTWFRETNNSFTAGAGTVATTTYTLAIPTGLSYNSLQIDSLNSRCLKLSFTGSSSTVTSMLWIDAQMKAQ